MWANGFGKGQRNFQHTQIYSETKSLGIKQYGHGNSLFTNNPITGCFIIIISFECENKNEMMKYTIYFFIYMCKNIDVLIRMCRHSGGYVMDLLPDT